ncbi:MAG: hypothetical protein RR310_02675 [Eubacterium sp.]
MIKIMIPKSFDVVAPYFEKLEHQKYLYIVAMDDDELQVIIRFKYKDDIVDVYEILEIAPNVSGAILDGIVRTMLFQMADLDCTTCRFHQIPERMKGYFENHGFTDCGEFQEHQDFANEFFKPCPGCGGDVD